MVSQPASLAGAQRRMSAQQMTSAVVVDDQRRYLGILSRQQMKGLEEESSCGIELQSPLFDENTSIWEAMQVMRAYMGEAIAVVDHE